MALHDCSLKNVFLFVREPNPGKVGVAAEGMILFIKFLIYKPEDSGSNLRTYTRTGYGGTVLSPQQWIDGARKQKDP